MRIDYAELRTLSAKLTEGLFHNAISEADYNLLPFPL